MFRRLVPPLLTVFAACASPRNGPQAPTDDVNVWKLRAEKDPDGFGPRLYVGYDAIGRKQWEEVDRIVAPLAARAAEDAGLRAPLGALYLAAARSAPARWRTSWLESARGLLAKASEERPENAEIHFNLGA